MKLVVTEKNDAAEKISQLLGSKATRDKVFNTPVYRFEVDGEEWVTIGLRGHILEPDFAPQLVYKKREIGVLGGKNDLFNGVRIQLGKYVGGGILAKQSEGGEEPIPLKGRQVVSHVHGIHRVHRFGKCVILLLFKG